PPTDGPRPTFSPPFEPTPAFNKERLSAPSPMPVVGRSRDSRALNELPIVALVVSITAAASVTSTVVAMALGCRVALRVAILLTSTRTLLVIAVAKPGAEALTSYSPAGRFVKRYAPLSPALVSDLKLVAGLTASTAAPGRPDPDASSTVPTRSPLIACARRLGDNRPGANKPSAMPAAQTGRDILNDPFGFTDISPKRATGRAPPASRAARSRFSRRAYSLNRRPGYLNGVKTPNNGANAINSGANKHGEDDRTPPESL